MIHRVTKEDSADLGFAWASLMAGAVTLDEFKTWAEHVVTEMEADMLPSYMIDVMEVATRRDATVGLKDITGFWPYDPLLENSANSTALHGIVALRGRFRAEDAGVSETEARKKFDAHPEIAARFAAVFPFLPLPAGECA